MEAADGCEFCGVKYEVKVTCVDKTGDFGDVSYSIKHRDYCPERQDPFMGETAIDVFHDIAGWDFSDRKLHMAGKEWPTLKVRANIGPCLNCWKLVVGVPLILWPGDGKVELDFCFKCAEELGILKGILAGLAIQMRRAG